MTTKITRSIVSDPLSLVALKLSHLFTSASGIHNICGRPLAAENTGVYGGIGQLPI